MTTYVIPTTAAEHIAKNMVGREDFELVIPEGNKEGKRKFPDNEVYTKIPRYDELKDRTVILHSGGSDRNSSYVELDQVLEILYDFDHILRHGPLEVFFTYFAYGGQDKVFQKGETNFAERIIKRLTKSYRVDGIYTIDAHFADEKWIRHYPIKNVSAVNLLKEAASIDYPKADILYLAPDVGSQKRTGLIGTDKKRVDSYNVEIQTSEQLALAVKGRVVGVVDDMIRTGKTMISFREACMKLGASDVIALCTHGVMESGIELIQEKFSRLYLTNTIEREQANVDVTDLVIETIKKGF